MFTRSGDVFVGNAIPDKGSPHQHLLLVVRMLLISSVACFSFLVLFCPWEPFRSRAAQYALRLPPLEPLESPLRETSMQIDDLRRSWHLQSTASWAK